MGHNSFSESHHAPKSRREKDADEEELGVDELMAHPEKFGPLDGETDDVRNKRAEEDLKHYGIN